LFLVLAAGAKTASGQLLNWPESVVFDAAHSRYLLSNYHDGYIVQVDSLGVQSYFTHAETTGIQGLEIMGNTVYVGSGYSVRGFDLTSGAKVLQVSIPGAVNLNDVTLDSAGNLYASDVFGHAIYKVVTATGAWSVFARDSIQSPNGIYYDPPNDRLLVCSFRYHSPIQAVSLADSSVTTVVATSINNCDGLTQDTFGSYYASAWGTTAIYKFDREFSQSPQLLYRNSGGPADIACNRRDNLLAIPLMNVNRLELLACSPYAVAESRARASRPGPALLVQPNPFRRAASVPGREGEEFLVSDAAGRRIAVGAGSRVGEDLRPGVYFLQALNTPGERVRVVKAE
jgi:sugar lactone lactonase YvrE